MKTHLFQAEADALCMSVEDLLLLTQRRIDEEQATILALEMWEYLMRRDGASESQIQAKRDELRVEMNHILGL